MGCCQTVDAPPPAQQQTPITPSSSAVIVPPVNQDDVSVPGTTKTGTEEIATPFRANRIKSSTPNKPLPPLPVETDPPRWSNNYTSDPIAAPTSSAPTPAPTSRARAPPPTPVPTPTPALAPAVPTHTPASAPAAPNLERRLSQRQSFKHRTRSALTTGKLLKAMYDFEGPVTLTLTFKAGDYMQLISDDDAEWYRVLHLATKIEGFVPKTYVTLQDSLQAHSWYHGNIERADAERILLRPGNPVGTFLVRHSQPSNGDSPVCYVLSIRGEKTSGMPQVHHYRVHVTSDGQYSFSANATFDSLLAAVEHHRSAKDGLTQRLEQACAKEKPQLWDLSPVTRDQWELDRRSLTIEETLGTGQFGEVYAGRWNRTTRVAIKKLKPGSMAPEAFLGEAQLMKKFQHPHIVCLYAVCTVEEPLLIVTELMVDSLLHYLRNGQGQHLDLRTLLYMAAQVADGMAYLERGIFGGQQGSSVRGQQGAERVVHRDLAARNILLGDNHIVKISDFGLARAIIDDEYVSHGSKFPYKWTAPEAITHSRFSVKSDVWSFGILLVELVTHGGIPYPGMTSAEVMPALERGYRHPKPLNCPEEVYNVMTSCWHKEPAARPSFETLKNAMSYLASEVYDTIAVV